MNMAFITLAKKISRYVRKAGEAFFKQGAASRRPETDALPIYQITSKSPFSHENGLDEKEIRMHYLALKRLGIRVMPYPFGHALSIVSDCDWLLRADYEGYRDLLVNKYGLDFGDSIKLHQNMHGAWNENVDGADAAFESAAVFTYRFTLDERDAGWNAQRRLLPYEAVREYALGNIDHLHGLSSFGPRIIWFRDFQCIGKRRITVPIPEDVERKREKPASFQAVNVPVLIVGVVFSHEIGVNADAVAHLHDGGTCKYTVGKPAISGKFYGGGWQVSLPISGDNTNAPVPRLGSLKDVEIHFDKDVNPGEITGIFCLNVDRSAVLGMLAVCYDRFNIRTNLFTDHASSVFLRHECEVRHAGFNAARLGRLPVPANYARAQGEHGAYSCLGDDPASVVYILPELRGRFGVRFINPGGTSGESVSGFDPLNAVSPACGRDGATVYMARRTRAPLFGLHGKPHPHDRLDQGARTFPLRLDSILERSNNAPFVWPFYTHLGNIMPKRERPVPYFPDEALGRLQDRVFNVTSSIPLEKRFWFTRASVLYDYCLMLRSLPGHVVREGGSAVRVEPWYDPILQMKLPVSLNQLHGITFYVDDSALAKVYVGDEEAVHLLRNPADETGRQSVTVLGEGPGHTVLDDVDVITRFGFRGEGGIRYAWIDDPVKAFRGRYYGRLLLVNSGVGRLVWQPKGLSPAGSQYFGYAIRKSSRDVRFGVFFSTKTGGTFYFGDKMGLLEGLNLTAFYLFPSMSCASWQTLWAPFYGLTWNNRGMPGGPIPSHEIQEVVFAVEGKEGQSAELDRMVFMRPATLDVARPNGCVLGGRLVVSGSNRTIRIKYHNREGLLPEREEIPDSLGNFIFTGIPVGAIVCILAEVDGKTFFPIQGECLDVWGDNLTLMIE